MKKLFLLCAALLLILTGCGGYEPEILFDEAAEGIVSVILEDYNDGTIHYDTVGPDGQRQETAPFESDPIEILTAAEGCFETTEESVNRLVKVELENAEADAVISRIFELCSGIEHEIKKLYILRINDEYFAVAELNIKTWLPARLYHYDADALTELYTYDATKVIGMKILNLP